MEHHFDILTHSSDLPTIDLHSIPSAKEALEELDLSIAKLLVNNEYCRIIYGIGEGVLRNIVAEYLDNSPYVASWKIEDSGGSCIVFFKHN